MSFNSIGFFQFDNLLRNRVPVLLLILEDQLEFASWYNSITRLHIEAISYRIQPNEIPAYLLEKKIQPQFGILVLDKDGQESRRVVESLEQAGYMNVFYIEGGYVQLLTEKDHNPN